MFVKLFKLIIITLFQVRDKLAADGIESIDDLISPDAIPDTTCRKDF